MLPISLSYFWYQSWMFLWVPNGANVFGFLLGWLLGLFAVFSLCGLIRMIFSLNFLSYLRALSFSLTTVRGFSLSALYRLFVYGLYTVVRVRALAYLYHWCTGGMFYFCTELCLVPIVSVYLVLMYVGYVYVHKSRRTTRINLKVSHNFKPAKPR
jgi:hypothetical protein